MNWIKVLDKFRYILLIAFGFLYALKHFNRVENVELAENFNLYDLTSLLVAMYLVVYLIQSRLQLKEKDKQIEELKSQLNIN